MMEKMMGQDGPMGDMMKNMQSMGPKEKMSMMMQMMPKCMSMMFGMLDPAARKELAGKMLNQMQEELKKQAGAPEETAEGDKHNGCG